MASWYSALSRSIWDDENYGKCEWKCNMKCIERPTYRGGWKEAYAECVFAMARALSDPRMTPEIEQSILFNINTNIPMSNYGSLLEFYPFMENN